MLYLTVLGCLIAASFCLWLGWFLRARRQAKAQESHWILLVFKHLFPTNRSFDGTFLLFGMISLCHITLAGLFMLELVTRFYPVKEGDEGAMKQLLIFTPEINHTLLTITVGVLGAFGGYFFGKASQQEAQQNTTSETKT